MTMASMGFVKAPKKIKVLCVTSDPDGLSQLRISREWRTIKDRVGFVIQEQGGTSLVEYVYIHLQAARLSDIITAIKVHQPDIVHFAGHGISDEVAKNEKRAEVVRLEKVLADLKVSADPDAALITKTDRLLTRARHEVEIALGGLCTMNDSNELRVLAPKDFVKIIRICGKSVVGIIFNACWGGEHGDLLVTAGNVQWAVGHAIPIGDRPAIELSGMLYASMAMAVAVKDAFDLAVLAVGTEQRNNEDIPRFFSRDGVNLEQLFLVHPSYAEEVPAPLAAAGFDSRCYEKKAIVVAETDDLDRAWSPSSDDDTRAG